MYKVHHPEPSVPGVAHTCNSSIQGWKQENQEFKIFLGYIANLRLAWVMWDLAHYPHLKEYIQEVSFHRYGKLGLHCYLWRAGFTNLCTFSFLLCVYRLLERYSSSWKSPLLNHEDQSVEHSTTSHVGQLISANNSNTKGLNAFFRILGAPAHTCAYTHKDMRTYKYINIFKVCM